MTRIPKMRRRCSGIFCEIRASFERFGHHYSTASLNYQHQAQKKPASNRDSLPSRLQRLFRFSQIRYIFRLLCKWCSTNLANAYCIYTEGCPYLKILASNDRAWYSINDIFVLYNCILKHKYSAITIFLSPFQRNYKSQHLLRYRSFNRTQVDWWLGCGRPWKI